MTGTTTSTADRPSRRDRLRNRARPTATYQLAVVDEGPVLAELAAAREELDRAELRIDPDAQTAAITAAKERLDVAKKAVAECYEPINMTALLPEEFEELVAAHPPRKDHDERWDNSTFPRASFLACVSKDDLSVEEWEEFVDGNVAQGERESLYTTAIGVNARWPSGSIPEG